MIFPNNDYSEYMDSASIIITIYLSGFYKEVNSLGSLDEVPPKQICKRCSFETNSEEIFTAHRRNCPRI